MKIDTRLRQIRAMAKLYQTLHDGWTIHTCVYKANEAYELYKDAEARVMLSDMYGD
jgi:hypothetical protein